MIKKIISSLLAVIMLITLGMTASAATLGTQLDNPESGWRRYDDTSNDIRYTNFISTSQSLAYGNSYNKSEYTNGVVKFSFYGTKLRIIGVVYPTCGNNVIKIDNVPYNFSQNGSAVYKALNFEKKGLALERHNVEITSDSSEQFYLDAIDIDDTGYLISSNTVSDLTATGGDASVTLNWSAISGANTYNIKISTTVDGTYITIKSSFNGTSFTDTDSTLTNNTTYYYVVTAVIPSGESENSNIASATPVATDTGNALLEITLTNGSIKEYDLSMKDVNAFISWYDGRSSGIGSANYVFNKKYNLGSFKSRKEYIAYSKIQDFEVLQYN